MYPGNNNQYRFTRLPVSPFARWSGNRQIIPASCFLLPASYLLPLAFCFLLLASCFLLPDLSAEDGIVYDDKGRRDPFIALVTPDGRLLNFGLAGSEEKIVLRGIIYDKTGCCYAIINDEIVAAGDYFQGLAVFKIEENKVILLQDDEPVEYILNEDEIY